MTSSNSKVYIEILKQIRSIIVADGLVAGDKIPSERELSERLKAGRSSVREALRSLELLGIIETRRGEGTFIKNFGDHQLVQILGTYILEDVKVKKDLIETKYLIERDSIVLACERMSEKQLQSLSELINTTEFTRHEFFSGVVKGINNSLFLRLWQVISEYFLVLQVQDPTKNNKSLYQELLDAFSSKNVEKALHIYEKLAIKEIVE
ncbi:FadR family transcriptional regulator [Bacillus luteolus]|uniref:FadR family transcriptional regulator n=1 Tax=Litchfieldia luteola TaxID=682179 RepID=A0ABR9QID3_9BACI|nr:GntR family transcriptional regulator [Cytobacillus luteolus]MBE4908253.1 FadR family transcriptional regulator [Cytobacillus luteolus]MBP1943039.1 DNA-binding FadR family transcriptional regulator [Cytobacillus luteolus]